MAIVVFKNLKKDIANYEIVVIDPAVFLVVETDAYVCAITSLK